MPQQYIVLVTDTRTGFEGEFKSVSAKWVPVDSHISAGIEGIGSDPIGALYDLAEKLRQADEHITVLEEIDAADEDD
jgi:hypothetical protein